MEARDWGGSLLIPATRAWTYRGGSWQATFETKRRGGFSFLARGKLLRLFAWLTVGVWVCELLRILVEGDKHEPH